MARLLESQPITPRGLHGVGCWQSTFVVLLRKLGSLFIIKEEVLCLRRCCLFRGKEEEAEELLAKESVVAFLESPALFLLYLLCFLGRLCLGMRYEKQKVSL